MSAQIRFTQGASSPPGGQALQGVTGTLVAATHSGGGIIIAYTWTMIDVPPGSAVPTGYMGNGNTVTFTPDVPGGYLVQLQTEDSLLITTSDVRAVLVPEDSTYSRIIPPFNAAGPSLNISGQARGWSPFMESYLHVVDRLRDVGGAAPLDTQVLTWVAANNRYEPHVAIAAASIQLTGDVTAGPGASPQATVVQKVKGTAIATAGGALAIGLLLLTTGAAAADWGSLSSATSSTGILPAANQAAQTMVGDVTGTTAASVVGKIQGNTVTSGALTKGQFLVATSTSNWAATALSGDLTESATTPGSVTVSALQGVVLSGTPAAGNGLHATGASAASWSALNLAGGANYVTGLLPAGNQAAQSLSGELSGTTAAAVVAGPFSTHAWSWTNAADVVLSIAATPPGTLGKSFTIQAGSPSGGGAVNGGDINLVSGVHVGAGTDGLIYIKPGGTTIASFSSSLATISSLAISSLAALGTGYATVSNTGLLGFTSTIAASAITLVGDVTGLASSNVVTTLTGTSSTVTVPNGTRLKFLDGTGYFATTGTIRTAPTFSIVGRNSSNATDVNLLQWDGSNNINFGASSGVGNLGFLANQLTVYTTGALYEDAQTISWRGAAHNGAMVWDFTALPTFTGTVDAAITSFTLTQAISTTGAGAPMAFRAQAAKAGSLGNAGGNLVLGAGAGDTTGLYGDAGFAIGGVLKAKLTQINATNTLFQVGGDGTNYKVLLGPYYNLQTSNAALYMLAPAQSPASVAPVIYSDGTSVTFNSPSTTSSVAFAFGGATFAFQCQQTASQLLLTLSNFNWVATATPALGQATAASDVATKNIVITAQAPFASAVTNIHPGDVIVNIPQDSAGGSTKNGGFVIQYNNNPAATLVRMGGYTGASYGCIWFVDGGTPSASNWAFLGNTTSTYFNAPAGGGTMYFGIGTNYIAQYTSAALSYGVVYSSPQYVIDLSATAKFHFTQNATTATLIYDARAADTATVAFTVRGMDAWSSAVTNLNGGDLQLQSGAKNSTGLQGSVLLQPGGALTAAAARYDANALYFFSLDAGLKFNASRNITASYTVDSSSANDLWIDCILAAAATLTLPKCSKGRVLYVADIGVFGTSTFDVRNLTLAPNGADKIEGTNANKVISTAFWRGMLVGDSTGTNWTVW